MRKCFLHVGTYKTGTSSIQWTLDNHRGDLARHNFLYPRSGIIPKQFGHHNIPWEIAGYPNYDRQYGTIEELISEISRCRQDVILSSEHFALAFPHLADFRSFIERMEQCGLRIAIVIYLRNRADYFRSAYFEILKAGCPVGFARFISKMIDHQSVRWGNHSAGGGSDIVKLLQQLATDKDLEIIARSYDRAKNSVVTDFLSVIGLTLADLGIEAESRENERMVFGDAFALFYRNRIGRSPNAQEAWLISCLADALDGNDIHMSDRARQMLMSKYEYQKQFLKQYGFREPPEPETEPGDSNADSDIGPCLEDVFSETMARFIEKTARNLASSELHSSGPNE